LFLLSYLTPLVCPRASRADRSFERPLRQPGYQWRRHRHESGHAVQRDQNVVGPYGRCSLPNNHSKYLTLARLCSAGTPIKFHADHGSTGVHPPCAVLREPLDLHPAGGEELNHCCLRHG